MNHTEELRTRIKKEVFNLDDDELDTEIAYRDVLNVVDNISQLIAKEKIAELEKMASIGWTMQTMDMYLSPTDYIEKRVEELKKLEGTE